MPNSSTSAQNTPLASLAVVVYTAVQLPLISVHLAGPQDVASVDKTPTVTLPSEEPVLQIDAPEPDFSTGLAQPVWSNEFPNARRAK